MNREMARNMDTDHIPVQRFCALLETFGLKHSSKQIADLLEKAENEEVQTVSPVSLRPKSEDVMSVDENATILQPISRRMYTHLKNSIH